MMSLNPLAVATLALLFFTPGCAFLLPRSHTVTRSKWSSYAEASAAFDRIVPAQTTTNDLAHLGFHPAENANVRVLTYLDIIQRFMPNQSITKEDLDEAVRACIDAREDSQAWEIDLTDVKSRRYGNALLDVTGFVKKTHETGWQFKGLLLIRDGRVTYKLASGLPQVDRHDKKVRPLGPLQEFDGILSRTLYIR
jgi:hypothetical protein